MTSSGILAAGAYAPALRLERETIAAAWGRAEASGIETTAIPEADEDTLTMGWEAGRRALAAADRSGGEVAWLGFATTTPPVEESDLTARLGSFFGVDPAVGRQVFTGSTRAGTRALFAALDATLDEGIGLVIASDAPRGNADSAIEHAAGAGAAAFLVGPDAPASIPQRAEYSTPFPGTRFRQRGSSDVEGLGITSYDRQAFREAVLGAVDGLGVQADAVDAVAVQAPDGTLPYRIAGDLGVGTNAIGSVSTVHELGDTGAASVPISLAVGLADEHDSLLGVAFGSGAGADAILVDAVDAVPTRIRIDEGATLSYPAALRRRGELTPEPPAGGGAMVTVPSWRRTIPQRHRLEAGRCPDCGALSFPPEGACPGCRELVDFEAVPLPRTGRVAAATRIERGGEPPEFTRQQAASGSYGVALVEFERDHGDVTVPLQLVGGVDIPDIGARVMTVVRRLYEQEGVIRYARKAQLESP